MAEEKTIKCLGKDCKIVVNPEKSIAKVSMGTSDFNDILASHGMTEEVRKVVNAAHSKVALDALTFAEGQFEALNKGKKEGADGFIKRVEVALGKGEDSMRVGFTGHVVSEGTGINGKPYHKETWGAYDIKLNYSFGRAERAEGGPLDQLAQKCCKFMGGKMSK